MAKKGRKHNIIYDDSGDPLYGLSYDSGSRSYYHIYTDAKDGKRKKLNLGRDKTKAISTLESFFTKDNTVTLGKNPRLSSIPGRLRFTFNPIIQKGLKKLGLTDDEVERLHVEILKGISIREAVYSEQVIWEKAKELVHRDFDVAAKRLELKFVKIEPNENIKLQDIYDQYINRVVDAIKVKDKADTKRWWSDFVDTVGVNKLNDLTLTLLKKYRDKVYQDAEQEGYTITYIDHRLSKIHAIFKYVADTSEKDTLLKDKVNLIKKIQVKKKRQKSTKRKPNTISSSNISKLIGVADPKFQAIILLSANMGFTPQDVCDTENDDLDLDNATLIMPRGKTGIVRVGNLWKRTVEALKCHIQSDTKNKSNYLFVSRTGAPFNADMIGDNFRRLRKKAGLPNNVQFRHFKDTVQTKTLELGCTREEATFLLGHTLPGVSDHYLDRTSALTKHICAILEKYYFPDDSSFKK